MTAPAWPLAASLRMPLQIGQSALADLCFISGLALNTLGLALANLPGSGPGYWIFVALVAAVAVWWLGLGWWAIRGARASDMVLGPAGFRVEGGPRNGLTLAWADLDPQRCRVENDHTPDAAGAPIRGRQLILGVHDKPDVLAAEVWQVDDRESLYVALDEIRAVHGLDPLPDDQRTAPQRAPGTPQPATAATPATPALLRCDRCGAAAVPADMAHVTCPMCQAQLAVPAELRTVIAAEHALADERARGRELVRALLGQRGATATNVGLALVGLFLLTIPTLGSLAYWQIHLADRGHLGLVIAAWIACVSLCLAVLELGTGVLGRRIALRACLVDLGARRNAEGPCCRACGATLADLTADSVLVRCRYCRADNVLGADLRPWQQAEAGRVGSLRQLLSEREARSGFTPEVIGCLVLAAFAGLWPLLAWLG